MECKIYNDIEHTKFDKLNEFQLSFLYLANCIWYGYKKTYAEWAKVETTEYPIGTYIYSDGCKFYLSVLDTFRPHSKLVLDKLNTY
jgi:hypothetical protein